MFDIASVIDLLKAVPKGTAAMPEFKKIYGQIVATFDKDTDQATLKDAYELAMVGAADANQDLDDLVKRNS